MIIRNIFSKGSYLGLRSVLLIALALLLVIGDFKHWFSPVRSFLSFVVYPVQYCVNLPTDVLYWAQFNLMTREQLLKENAKLREQALLLNTELQKVAALTQENLELRTLLGASKQVNRKVTTAQLLTVASSRFGQEMLLNRGKNDGLYVGQPVLDAYGVMGQVVATDLLLSRVLMITDPKSAVPVLNIRTGMQAIVVGTGDGLELLHIPDTADIQVGDLLMVSALASQFPYGYPVGVVASVAHISGAQFATVKVKPNAHLGGSRYVLLVEEKKI